MVITCNCDYCAGGRRLIADCRQGEVGIEQAIRLLRERDEANRALDLERAAHRVTAERLQRVAAMLKSACGPWVSPAIFKEIDSLCLSEDE